MSFKFYHNDVNERKPFHTLLFHYWMRGYWISSIIWADLTSGSCGICSGSFFKMEEKKEGRRIAEQTRDAEHTLSQRKDKTALGTVRRRESCPLTKAVL